MSKPIKYGLIGLLIVAAIVVVYYLFKGSSANDGWTVYTKKSFEPGWPVAEEKAGLSVADAKKYADSKGYKAFFRNGSGTVWFFGSMEGKTFTDNAGGDSYVKA